MPSQDRPGKYQYLKQNLQVLIAIAYCSLMIASNGSTLLAYRTDLDESAKSVALNNNTKSNLKGTSLLHSPTPQGVEREQRGNQLSQQSNRLLKIVKRSQESIHDRSRMFGEKTLDSSSQSGLKLAHSTTTMIGPNIITNDINDMFAGASSSSPLSHPPTAPMAAALISTSTMSTDQANNMSAEYATVNYNGVIGINATDPLAITTESRIFSLPIGVQLLMCLLYGTLAFTAVTSNVIVCYIVLTNSKMRTATNYFIVNLAVGDILMALLCIPFTFLSNLILQYWPFGLSLCVIVSYSQANSVFISAYTMVAISIDKYIAIMYPMRLRMPKTQAKVIILVIWSAALMTSLPIAILSSLTPASPDLGPPVTPTVAPINMSSPTMSPQPSLSPPTATTPQVARPPLFSDLPAITTMAPASNSNRPRSSNMEQATAQSKNGGHGQQYSGPNAIQPLGTITATNEKQQEKQHQQHQHQQQEQQQQLYEERNKYFCQESWESPEGRYYYSMGLMVLQFVLPLFVLVITYTRIVIAVWGKKMPGEEDNARDARMARSKRKMIKMVIFCVIAFALTWLPFNALIVFGDLRPDIWENPNIMYIWFITHYLAMCHTVTNPLIYIWMNNRFRAGFKQVISDFCKLLQTTTAFLLCYCLCLGCCFDCSRRKYARVALDLNRRKQARRGPLTSTGSVNVYANNLGNNSKNAHNAMLTSTNNNNNNSHSNNHNTTTATTSTNNTNVINSSSQVESTVNNNTSSTNNGTQITTNNDNNNNNNNKSGRLENSSTINGASLEPTRQTAAGSGGGQPDEPTDGMSQPAGEQQQQETKTWLSNGGPKNVLDPSKQQQQQQKQREANEQVEGRLTSIEAPAKSGAKKKRRKRQSHAISLQMTTCQFYSAKLAPQHKLGCRGQLTDNNNDNNHVTGRPSFVRWKFARKSSAGQGDGKRTESVCTGGSESKSTKTTASTTSQSMPTAVLLQSDCPACRARLTQLQATGQQQQQQQHQQRAKQPPDRFLLDTRQSSQSTASISAHTYNTSVAISPINSTSGAGGAGASAGSGSGGAAEVANNSNTSASSFSANGGGGSGSGQEQDRLATSIKSEAADEDDNQQRQPGKGHELEIQLNDRTWAPVPVQKQTRRGSSASSSSGLLGEPCPVSERRRPRQRQRQNSVISSQSSGSMPAEEANVMICSGGGGGGGGGPVEGGAHTFCNEHRAGQRPFAGRLQTRSDGDDGQTSGETEDDAMEFPTGDKAAGHLICRATKSSGSLELISGRQRRVGINQDHYRYEYDEPADELDEDEDVDVEEYEEEDDFEREDNEEDDMINTDDDDDNDEDEDEDEDEDLEAQFGDEESPLRRGGATEMVLIRPRARRPGERPHQRGKVTAPMPRGTGQLALLNRLFKSTGDELYGRPQPSSQSTRQAEEGHHHHHHHHHHHKQRPAAVSASGGARGGSTSPLHLAINDRDHYIGLEDEATAPTKRWPPGRPTANGQANSSTASDNVLVAIRPDRHQLQV